ncbi:MAG: hypothetical protein AAF466_12495 [Bacteroidota bacterium]
MKTLASTLTICLCMLVFTAGYAQIGIGTNSPEGILDVSSTTSGFVYPSVALTSTNTSAPVANPQGGALAVGTTIFNTATTNTGSNDVEPGIYSWNGSAWITHFFKRQSEKFEQSSSVRTSSSAGFENITGLVGQSFTADYSGTYKIEVKTSFGGGEMQTGINVNVGMVTGTFRFNWNGTNYDFNTKAFSVYNSHISGGTHYVDQWKESYITEYVTLTAGAAYSFTLTFDQDSATGFVNSGNSGNGRGYIGTELLCMVEITYIDE